MSFLLVFAVIGLVLLAAVVAIEVRLWRRSTTGKVIAAGIAAFLGFHIYTAIYPPESFYQDEFERVTGLTFPNGARFRFKEASYPDFHGDYTSCALIEVTQSQYEFLKSKISPQISKASAMGSSCMDRLGKAVGALSIASEVYSENSKGEYTYWGLVAGSQQVVVHYVSW